MGSKTKLGRIVLIDNNDQKPNEAPLYYRVYTEKNKEDWGAKGWLQDKLD